MTTKSTEKKATKADNGKAVTKVKGTQEKPSTTTGRIHTIAKPRSMPVTGKPPDPMETAPNATTIETMRTAEATAATPQPSDDGSEIVVFAFRLTRAERDTIHAAAGSAKASRFVRDLVLAAARGDAKATKETLDTIHHAG